MRHVMTGPAAVLEVLVFVVVGVVPVAAQVDQARAEQYFQRRLVTVPACSAA